MFNARKARLIWQAQLVLLRQRGFLLHSTLHSIDVVVYKVSSILIGQSPDA
jgi:hypothetical protein